MQVWELRLPLVMLLPHRPSVRLTNLLDLLRDHLAMGENRERTIAPWDGERAPAGGMSVGEFNSFRNELLVLFPCAPEEKRIRRRRAPLGHFRDKVRAPKPVRFREINL